MRVKAGEETFDPDFFVDLVKATGGPAIPGTWRIDDRYVLARVWNPDEPLPETIDEYWSDKFISKRIDIQTRETTDFDTPAEGGFSSNIQDRVDGVTYFPLPKDDGSGDVAYRLKPDGVEEAFTISGGGYWGMGRLR